MMKLTALVLAMVCMANGAFASVVYDISEDNGLATVTGTITTDGTFGQITNANITAFDLVLDNGTYSSTLSLTNARLLWSNAYMDATSSQLSYNFSQSGSYFLFYENNNVGFWCLEGANDGCAGVNSTSIITINNNGSRVYNYGSARSGSYVLGTVSAIPLPAAFPLFLVALGGLGFAARRRKAA